MEFRAPKGVFDIYPKAKEPWQDSRLWVHLENILRQFASTYFFKEIRTPVFEHLELFQKGVGDGSDIVTKEMYQFLDKGGRELALRPEGTAAVIRAYLENKLYAQEKKCKLYYIAPMFRYERQQAGRYRQHHQFGAEAIGSSSPYQDVEIIEMAYNLYKKLGLSNLKLLINCVGSGESRKAYTDALRDFLTPKFNLLSEDSKVRFQKNMLRILDSKDPNDQNLLEGCPNILEFLDDEKRNHFNTVLETLTTLGIPFEITPKLVRGLDYYDSTVFEIISQTERSTLTLGGGGRYDGLIESYSGLKIPSVGFGTGLERLIQAMISQNVTPSLSSDLSVYMIPLDDKALPLVYQLTHKLREIGISCDMELSGRKLKNALAYASEIGAAHALLVGEEELLNSTFKLKDLNSRQEFTLSEHEMISHLIKSKTKHA